MILVYNLNTINMEDLHQIQMLILKELLFNPTARFSELNIKGLSNDHFSYHINTLIEQGYVRKTDRGYSLTNQGKEFANRMDTDQVQIEKERDQYQKELEERLKQQELELNPEKKMSQTTFLDSIKENTVSGQVVKSREDIQKGREHITPQGPVSSYTNNGSGYNQQ